MKIFYAFTFNNFFTYVIKRSPLLPKQSCWLLLCKHKPWFFWIEIIHGLNSSFNSLAYSKFLQRLNKKFTISTYSVNAHVPVPVVCKPQKVSTRAPRKERWLLQQKMRWFKQSMKTFLVKQSSQRTTVLRLRNIHSSSLSNTFSRTSFWEYVPCWENDALDESERISN